MTQSGARSPVPAAGSHTSTPQWQTFEVRMRRRRAERCLMRADVAFSAGFLEDARAATDEAKELDPAWTAVAEMEERLAAGVTLPDLILRTEPVEVELTQNHAQKSGHGFLLTVALTLASVVLVAVAALGWRAGAYSLGLAPASSRAAATLAADPVVDAELEPALPAPVVPAPVPPAPAEPVAVSTSGLSEPAATKAPAVAGTGVKPPSAAATYVAPPGELARDARPAATNVIPPPVVNEPNVRSPQDDPVAAFKPPVVETAPLAAALPSSPAIPVSTPEPAAPNPSLTPEAIAAVDARSAVRATLARYEAAYSALNVSAARAVWPAVDERALARAFDGLSSQRVALDRCDVSVAGGTAKAICSGSAEWTPKVGGGQRRQNRRWAFELANASGTWQIVRADAR
jgi:hypothetical protein